MIRKDVSWRNLASGYPINLINLTKKVITEVLLPKSLKSGIVDILIICLLPWYILQIFRCLYSKTGCDREKWIAYLLLKID